MNRTEVIVFGGGCFWCTEAVFLRLKGVTSVMSGYAGGLSTHSTDAQGLGQAPTYEEVSTGRTGHAEVIHIEYDPTVIPFSKLLEVFFMAHDPTTVNRQGADVGEQYRSIILWTNEDQKREAELFIAELTAGKKFPEPIVTEVKALERFWPAEEYHRDYYAKHSGEAYSQAIIAPKIRKLKREHSDLLAES
ncbi:MAG: peptide-methionine (S)-S-oxide reductase MsrA [bacterium]|nr:peptide-methionine (S)-S-oxide reductase MsrA [bacterium]